MHETPPFSQMTFISLQSSLGILRPLRNWRQASVVQAERKPCQARRVWPAAYPDPASGSSLPRGPLPPCPAASSRSTGSTRRAGSRRSRRPQGCIFGAFRHVA